MKNKILSPKGHVCPPTPYTENEQRRKQLNDATIWIHESHKPSDSNVTETVTVMSKKIRDSISFTSMTKTAREPLNLHDLDEREQDELSDLLMGEL